MKHAKPLDSRSFFAKNKWLLMRRLSQLSIFAVFIIASRSETPIIKGNLTSSLTLETLPLTDPFFALQNLLAQHTLSATVITGAVIVTLFYMLVGGRVYCSWVCPVNSVTDLASWLRKKMNIKGSSLFPRTTRYWLLATSLLAALIMGSPVWEQLNPVSMVQRGIIFGLSLSLFSLLIIFLFDLLISHDAWCGHLCPQGALYSLIGKKSLLRISASKRDACDDCMDCFIVCPEEFVIKPALKPSYPEASPVIYSSQCTNCGRCIDVCSKEVFNFSSRFNRLSKTD